MQTLALGGVLITSSGSRDSLVNDICSPSTCMDEVTVCIIINYFNIFCILPFGPRQKFCTVEAELLPESNELAGSPGHSILKRHGGHGQS